MKTEIKIKKITKGKICASCQLGKHCRQCGCCKNWK